MVILKLIILIKNLRIKGGKMQKCPNCDVEEFDVSEICLKCGTAFKAIQIFKITSLKNISDTKFN